jgi:hypothetical protein
MRVRRPKNTNYPYLYVSIDNGRGVNYSMVRTYVAYGGWSTMLSGQSVRGHYGEPLNRDLSLRNWYLMEASYAEL